MFMEIFFSSWFRRTKTFRIMQFQSQLLKQLITPSTAVKRWRNQIKSILINASDIIEVYFLYAFVLGEDDRRDMEIFWLRTAPADMVKNAEELLKRKLADDGQYKNITEFNIIHSTALPEFSSAVIGREGIALLTKTFHIDTPHESGFVGIGLSACSRRRPSELVAVDSILTAFINVISSVKALSAYTRDVERFATRDPLTNLYNQISFWDLLEYETIRSKRQEYKFALLVIDLDNFKTINDSYDHETGDAFLKDVASILKSAVRSGDIAARYAGDQFAAILPVCDAGQAFIVAKRVLDNLRSHALQLAQGGSIKCTASIGGAIYPDHAKEAKDLFLLADNMLAQAKSFGKDRLSMPSEQDNVEVLKNMGEQNILILEALAQHRIVPYFQPIVSVKNGGIEAYEVLTRINTNDRVIPAAEFIETAECMGAIGKIDYQLFEHAFAKVRECNYAGNLFINLSPKALVLKDFMPTIRKMLSDYGQDPCKLVFEITERDTIKNLKLVDKFINELKHEGFRFAIDDFGAGYSSFQYIKNLSVDFLKIDGEFIRRMNGSASVEKHIVTSIAALAAHLGINTIAEYVESKDILGEVESAGINFAQGYYIQRPSPDLF